MTRRKKCGRFGWLLIVLTIAALIMRILGCFWGLPLQLHPDEPATVDYAIEMLSRHSWMAQSFDRPDHFEIKCDVILCFFVLLFTWMLFGYLESGKSRYIYFAAAVIGVCITIKYNGAILCLPLALAVIYRSVREKCGRDILRLGILSVLLVVGTVFVIAPNLFLDYKVVIANILREARPNHLGADGLSFSGNSK